MTNKQFCGILIFLSKVRSLPAPLGVPLSLDMALDGQEKKILKTLEGQTLQLIVYYVVVDKEKLDNIDVNVVKLVI